MATIHGKATQVLCDQFDLSPWFRNASKSVSIEPGETTTFQVPQGSKTYIVGLNDGTISLEGLFDGAAGAVDAYLASIFNTAVDRVVSVAPQSTGTFGNPAWMSFGVLNSWETASPIADVVTTNAEFQADGGVTNGAVLIGYANYSTNGVVNGPALDNLVASANGGVGHIHVTVNSRSTSSTFAIQHSTDNISFTDIINFTAVPNATVTAQRLVYSGTVNRYVRANMNLTAGSGGIFMTIIFARR